MEAHVFAIAKVAVFDLATSRKSSMAVCSMVARRDGEANISSKMEAMVQIVHPGGFRDDLGCLFECHAVLSGGSRKRMVELWCPYRLILVQGRLSGIAVTERSLKWRVERDGICSRENSSHGQTWHAGP